MRRKLKGSIAVIGGGIAGVCTAELFKRRGYDVILFEKSEALGGCAGSFHRNQFRFNIGAATVAGLLPSFPVRKILSAFNVLDEIKLKNPGLVVHTKRGTIKRYQDLSETIEEINRFSPYKKNKEFWRTVYEVTRKVLCHDYYCNFNNIFTGFKTFWNMKELIINNFRHFLLPAELGLRMFFSKIDRDYYDFMDSHVKIVAQSSIDKVNFLTLLLSLGYPFTGIGYPKYGMGCLINKIAKQTPYFLETPVKEIKKLSDGYLIDCYISKRKFNNIVIACPIFENMKMLKDISMKNYFSKFLKLLSDNSAVVVYGVLKDFISEDTFNLIINSEILPDTSSRYLFVSFEDPIVINGEQYVTFTVSTHTSTYYWSSLSNEEYNNKKVMLEKRILDIVKDTFNIDKSKIILSFSATPETFYKYINRRSVGGTPVEIQNPFWKIPSNFTPFKGVYLVGDSFFSYQGWIGISLGILNLLIGLNEKI